MWLLLVSIGLVGAMVLLWAFVTQPVSVIQDVRLPAPVTDPERLERHVRIVCETFFPRSHAQPENLARASGYIYKEFEQARGRVSYQPYEVNGHTYRNVIASFGPETQERIVVGAHYDTAEELPGADDNASGVAGLIELAYLLGSESSPMQVELVAYVLEEPPFFGTAQMGSAVHATSLKQLGASVRIMIALEMIGFFSDSKNSQRFPLPLLKLFYPSRGNFIAVVGDLSRGSTVRRIKKAMAGASALPVYSINAPRFVPGIDWSDHLSYWEAGYSAVMITDTSFYRNANYHTAHDTPDTLDYQRMAMVVQGVHSAVLALSH
jgi:hypothetical protein